MMSKDASPQSILGTIMKETGKYFNPKKKLERILQLAILATFYFWILIYQNILGIDIPLLDLKTLIGLPIIYLLIGPLIHYTIIKADSLQRGVPKRASIRFFQAEFPSKYLLRRCNGCIESQKSCRNFIAEESGKHLALWFSIFRGPIETSNPGRVNGTLEKGYTCKLLYYLSIVLFFSGIAGSLSLLLKLTKYIPNFNWAYTLMPVQPFQVIYPAACFFIFALIRMIHKPRNHNPTGCWHAWRQINRMNISWLRDNENYLVDTICKANANDKTFQPKIRK